MIGTEEEARAYVAARCDPAAMAAIERFVGLLTRENARQNLVSAPSMGEVWRRHVADSAQLLDHARDSGTGTWLDLGTGAGFPGLIIAIMRPQTRVTLVESRRLRIEWLTSIARELELHNCSVEGARVEAIRSVSHDVISARAFAPLGKLLFVAGRFSTSDTLWLLPKGRSAAQELASLPESTRKMFHVEPSVTDPEAGLIIGRLTQGRRT